MKAREYINLTWRTPHSRQVIFAFNVFRNVYGEIVAFVNFGARTYWLKH